MSQTATGTASSTSSKTTASKKLLCKSFTEQQISAMIDPNLIITQLQASGIQYSPQTPYAIQARAILVEDIKMYVANYFKANNIDIEEDEAVAAQINTIFEAALIKSNPYFAQVSGAISKERLQELAAVAGFGFGMGMGMPGMNPMMGGMGMGMPGQMMGGMGYGSFGAPQMPMWSSKKADAGKTQQQQPQQGFGFQNPMMGMGMPGMNPMMGMGFQQPMGMNPMMGMGMPYGMQFGQTGI